MNKWLIFLGGFVVGVVFTIAGLYVLFHETEEGLPTNTGIEGVTMFDEPGEIINENQFQVFQVIAENAALVTSNSLESDSYGTVFAIMNREDHYYYDNEQIKVPKNKVVRQVGIYKYHAKSDIIKTVPIIKIVEK